MGKLLFLGVAAFVAVKYISFRTDQQKKVTGDAAAKPLASGAAREAVIDVPKVAATRE